MCPFHLLALPLGRLSVLSFSLRPSDLCGPFPAGRSRFSLIVAQLSACCLLSQLFTMTTWPRDKNLNGPLSPLYTHRSTSCPGYLLLKEIIKQLFLAWSQVYWRMGERDREIYSGLLCSRPGDSQMEISFDIHNRPRRVMFLFLFWVLWSSRALLYLRASV